ncbi:MAG: ABC transporter permease [Polyangiales bacterium]
MKLRWRPIAGIVLRQAYLLRSSPARLLPTFAWVAVDIVLWGFIARYLNVLDNRGLDFVAQLLGAVLFWDFFARVMQGVTVAFFEDVWSRNFLNVFATPLSIGQYITGLVLTSLGTSLIGLTAMVLTAAAFGLSLPLSAAQLLQYALVLFGFGTALGICACALVLRFGPASEWLVWPIPALLSPFAGVFYPLSTLPGWMQWIGRLMPPSYVFEELRALLAGQAGSPYATPIALSLAALQVMLALGLFVRVHRHAVRSGLLARYSAESVA